MSANLLAVLSLQGEAVVHVVPRQGGGHGSSSGNDASGVEEVALSLEACLCLVITSVFL